MYFLRTYSMLTLVCCCIHLRQTFCNTQPGATRNSQCEIFHPPVLLRNMIDPCVEVCTMIFICLRIAPFWRYRILFKKSIMVWVLGRYWLPHTYSSCIFGHRYIIRRKISRSFSCCHSRCAICTRYCAIQKMARNSNNFKISKGAKKY